MSYLRNFAGSTAYFQIVALSILIFHILNILYVYVFKLRLRTSKQSLACQWCCAYCNLGNHAVVQYFIFI
jgi:hypothetical protein